VIITGPVPTQVDITVGTIFTGKALALVISALTMGKVTAIGVTATGVIRTEGMATGVIRAGVIAMGIPMGVMAMEVIRMGATPTVVMAMEVIPTGTRLARATRNYRIERVLARHDLAGMARGFHPLIGTRGKIEQR
jgi:hypothetical protein